MKLLLLAQALVATLANRASEAGSLHVVAPKELLEQFAPNGEIEMSPAMFGIPAYSGREVQGLAVYAPTSDHEGCEPIDKSLIPNWPDVGVVVLLVDRGNCTFVTKVQQAEDTGAAATVIVDNREERYLPYMADDGHGSLLQIPSMLIHKDDGAKIKNYIDSQADNNKPVMLSLSWDYANVDNVVEWELYTTLANRDAANFRESFAEAVRVLGKSAYFTPHLFTVTYRHCLADFKDANASGYEQCRENCIRGGRYCANADRDTKTPGHKVLQAEVTALCVWQEVNRTAVDVSAYFTYSAQMTKTCLSGGLQTQCSEQLMQGLGIDVDAVNGCVAASGGVDQDTDAPNSMLDAEADDNQEKNVRFDPVVHVNGFRYTGNMNCPTPIDRSHCGVLASVCIGFKDVGDVSACVSDPDCPLGQVKDMSNTCGGNCTFDQCNQCLEQGDKKKDICVGCDNVPFSGIVDDACGVCGGAGRDKCNHCYEANDTRRVPFDSNTSCEPKNTSSATKPQVIHQKSDEERTGFGAGAIVLIVIGCVGVVGIGVFCFMKHRQRQLKEDIDALLKQYLPMDAEAGAQSSHHVAVI